MAGYGYCQGNNQYLPWDLKDKKKSDVKEKTEWRNLFASIVQNTSMTMEDIGNLRINQMEDLLEGMNENAEALEREMKGEVKPLEGDAAIRKLMGGM